ncbi:VOC family protein [Microbacterium binotii]|uniref:VOC family protein n=1 Tax=Microbacterium binotii TaxID=462710 RepID=UPI001F320478|nr:VOC family protein [Microbacterium binotii]UIN30097.1 VOC family protein [Microbacterium binotii]
MARIHHIEIWVADLQQTVAEWAWLLTRLGSTRQSEWANGQSWSLGEAYLTLTTSPALSDPEHDRRRAGVNHLAFAVDTTDEVDAIMADAGAHGWRPLYHDRYPHAGGPDHYAGWVENSAGFKAEIVAALSPAAPS